jgi:hypothetical protein
MHMVHLTRFKLPDSQYKGWRILVSIYASVTSMLEQKVGALNMLWGGPWIAMSKVVPSRLCMSWHSMRGSIDGACTHVTLSTVLILLPMPIHLLRRRQYLSIEPYVELANTVMQCTVNARQVYSILCSMAKKDRAQVTWPLPDVHTLCRGNAAYLYWYFVGFTFEIQKRGSFLTIVQIVLRFPFVLPK